MMKEIRVLIAESEPRVCKSLCEMLQRAGYLVVGETGDGSSAISLAQHLRPDLVLLDIDIPTGGGLDVAVALHNEMVAPVLLTASHCTHEVATRAREAGVLGFLLKPINESELMPSIEVACVLWNERRRRQRELSRLRDKIDSRAVIEQAKGYLMHSQGLQETEAFRKMQRLAMNSRKTMREVAQAILLTRQISPEGYAPTPLASAAGGPPQLHEMPD
jgi:response regulator NasT